MVSFVVDGPIRALGRARMTRAGRCYKAGEDVAYQRRIKAAFVAAGGRCFPGTSEVAIEAVYAPPKSWSLTRRSKALANIAPCIQRSDIDNVAKQVLDALNGVAWDDDRFVTALTITRLWSETSELRVGIRRDVAGVRNNEADALGVLDWACAQARRGG